MHENVADEFITKLTARVAALKVARGTEDGAEIGPLINQAGHAKVRALVEDAVARGAEVLTGGKPNPLGENFFDPTILTGITGDMAIANQEIFGPVVPVMTFSSEEEAIQMANDTPYGLAAYFYSQDLGRVWRVMEALEYGMVGINEGIVSTEIAPFGGIKESGIGREGSKHGLDEYLELKYALMGGLSA